MHTQLKDGSVQLAVTLTPATTNAEKKNKDTSGGATERIRRNISHPKVRAVGGSMQSVAGTQMHRFERLMGAPGDMNSYDVCSALGKSGADIAAFQAPPFSWIIAPNQRWN